MQRLGNLVQSPLGLASLGGINTLPLPLFKRVLYLSITSTAYTVPGQSSGPFASAQTSFLYPLVFERKYSWITNQSAAMPSYKLSRRGMAPSSSSLPQRTWEQTRRRWSLPIMNSSFQYGAVDRACICDFHQDRRFQMNQGRFGPYFSLDVQWNYFLSAR